jgi:hypothetical protein
MVRIHGQQGQVVGELDEQQFTRLRDHFEEEGTSDPDYYVTEQTVEMLLASGADFHLVHVLRAAVAPASEGELRWSRP